MQVVKIVLGILAPAFLLFGYLIYFRRRYFLINGFREELSAGRRDENYARRVGLTELIIGLILLVAEIIVLILF